MLTKQELIIVSLAETFVIEIISILLSSTQIMLHIFQWQQYLLCIQFQNLPRLQQEFAVSHYEMFCVLFNPPRSIKLLIVILNNKKWIQKMSTTNHIHGIFDLCSKQKLARSKQIHSHKRSFSKFANSNIILEQNTNLAPNWLKGWNRGADHCYSLISDWKKQLSNERLFKTSKRSPCMQSFVGIIDKRLSRSIQLVTECKINLWPNCDWFCGHTKYFNGFWNMFSDESFSWFFSSIKISIEQQFVLQFIMHKEWGVTMWSIFLFKSIAFAYNARCNWSANP